MSASAWRVMRLSTLEALAAGFLAAAIVATGSPLASQAAESAPGCSGPKPQAGSPAEFPVPEVRESSGGVLQTTLHTCIGTNEIVDQPTGKTRKIETPSYEGSIPGPTLVLSPGDKLSIDLVNDLPPNPKKQRGGAFPHDPYTTNFHAHGLSVSPLGISDNVLRDMEPRTTNQIVIDIPTDQPTGTYWYHPHKHGATTFQLTAGMAGFLIIKGGPGTLDAVPEVAAAKDVPMAIQIIRTGLDGKSPFVNEDAEQFGTFPFGTTDLKQQGVFSTYGLDGAPGRSYTYYTNNGVTNPTLHMHPGEVQRWRLLNASEGDNLLVALEGHGLNVVAMDGITVPNMYELKPGKPLVMGPGQRMDVLVQAGAPGTYKLTTSDPSSYDADVVAHTMESVSPSGIEPAARTSRHSFDFTTPCPVVATPAPPPAPVKGDKAADAAAAAAAAAGEACSAKPPAVLQYPVALATVIVDGPPVDMKLPSGPLPVPKDLPSVAKMLSVTPNAVRHVAFEICANKKGIIMEDPAFRLPDCGWYFAKYDAKYWGGKPFNVLLMMRDDDDKGKPSDPPNKAMLLVDFKKDGLFNAEQPLFDDMIAGNYEEWTVVNRSFSDHPFHIHQNPFLVTKVNGMDLPTPEWHDTFIVPGATPQPTTGQQPPPQPNINKDVAFGSITFRIYFNPRTVGCFVMHCHTLSHEDMGMMQRLDILPAAGQPSGCAAPTMDH